MIRNIDNESILNNVCYFLATRICDNEVKTECESCPFQEIDCSDGVEIKEFLLSEFIPPKDAIESLGYIKKENDHGIRYLNKDGFDVAVINKMDDHIHFIKPVTKEFIQALDYVLGDLK